MRITRTQLRRIIREAIDVVNADSGEVMEFGQDPDAARALGQTALPDSAWHELQRRLGIASVPGPYGPEISDADFERLRDEVEGKRHRRKVQRRRLPPLDPDALMAQARTWATEAGADWAADNPGADLSSVAPDLARSVKLIFTGSEWRELLASFDWDEESLYSAVAETIADAV